jgi:hypothetical protein
MLSNGIINVLTRDITLKRMHTHTRKLILTAAGTLAILLFCPASRANTTLEITSVYSWSYIDSNGDNMVPGPYMATIGGVQNLLVYCLDLHVSTPISTTFDGYLTHPNTPAEDEAAFLAAYSLNLGAPSGNLTIVQNYEGPISMAIWQLMGTLNQNGDSTPPDPAAQYFINIATAAYNSGQISNSFLSSVNIWNPGTPGSGSTAEQRFIVATTPEPTTLVFLGSGLVLIALSQIRRRRRR